VHRRCSVEPFADAMRHNRDASSDRPSAMSAASIRGPSRSTFRNADRSRSRIQPSRREDDRERGRTRSLRTAASSSACWQTRKMPSTSSMNGSEVIEPGIRG
jgi:hypothetical protein